MSKKRLPLLIAVMLAFSPRAFAAFGFKLDGTLDKEAISHAYFEGEFTRALIPLEIYRQSFPAYSTEEDSIFVYKYLSVIYAASPQTRQKGESCMVQLIKMKPTIELIDLYISDSIEAIFRNVKQKYEQQQKYTKAHDIFGNEKKDTTLSAAPKTHSKNWIWWTIGGVGTAVIATTAYFALSGDDQIADQPTDFKP